MSLLQRGAFVFYWLANHFHSLDTPEGVAQELVSAGLISGQDLVVGKECFLKTYLPTRHLEVIKLVNTCNGKEKRYKKKSDKQQQRRRQQ